VRFKVLITNKTMSKELFDKHNEGVLSSLLPSPPPYDINNQPPPGLCPRVIASSMNEKQVLMTEGKNFTPRRRLKQKT